MFKSMLFAAVAISFAFAPVALAEKRTEAQIAHDKFCASLKSTYDAVRARNASVNAGRKGRLALYNIRLLGEQNNCGWATRA